MKKVKGNKSLDSASKLQSAQQQQNVKKQEEQPVDKSEQKDDGSYQCQICQKKYSTQIQLLNHNKLKHLDDQQSSIKRKSAKDLKKMETDQNDLQDTIYAFLGELGQIHGQNIQKNQSVIPNEDNKMTGHSNYCQNKVVRTPYQAEMNVKTSIPNQLIQKSQHKDFLKLLQKQLFILADQVQSEKQMWQFRDPMDPDSLTEKQFSLMDIRKLIRNLPDKKLNLTQPHFQVFVLWVSRICKPPAWKQFFYVIGTLCAIFEKQKGDKVYQNLGPRKRWNQFWNNFQANHCQNFFNDLQICDKVNGQKMLQNFVRWTEVFQIIPQQ